MDNRDDKKMWEVFYDIDHDSKRSVVDKTITIINKYAVYIVLLNLAAMFYFFFFWEKG